MKLSRRGPAPLLVALLLATGLAVPFLASSARAAGPSLVVEPATLDFGRMNQHQIKSAEVTLRNAGDQPLSIYGVEPSCGCTVADLKTDELAPGQSTVLPITFDSKAFSGPQHKNIRISTNDPDQPNFEIPITATVFVPLLVDPPRKQVGFGNVRRGEEATRTVTFTAMDAPELTVKPVRWNKEIFDLEVRHDFEGNPAAEQILVKIKPDAPLGNHREFMTVSTDLADEPSVDVELFAEIVQDLTAQPERINFRYVERGKQLSQSVRISAADPAISFKVTGVDVGLAGFTARVEQKSGREALVFIEGVPLPENDERVIAAKGRMLGTVTIHTDLPSVPELKVEVVYLVRL